MKNSKPPAPAPRPRVVDLVAQLDASEEAAAKYRQLLDLARSINFDTEVDRLATAAAEMEADAEDIREQLIALGYEPD